MAKTGLLNPLQVQRETRKGRYGDGGGLYLQVKPAGGQDGVAGVSKTWLFRYKFEGRAKMLGLGPFTTTNSLATARRRAAALRALLEQGVDPLAHRAAERQKRREEEARAVTFEQCTDRFIAARPDHWKSENLKEKWRASLAKYAFPIIGHLSVPSLDEPLILKVLHQDVPPMLSKDGAVLKPGGLLWIVRAETATKIRNRIELVLDFAKVSKLRSGENPARWRANLDHALGRRNARRRRKHYPALPYSDVPAFMTELRGREDEIAAKALEFLIVTTTRTNETLGARWPEIDEAAAVWIIPPERMKAEREHRVPLPPQAIAILRYMRPISGHGEFVFPGRKPRKPLSNMTLLQLLRRMGRSNITVHGFRSTFRDFIAEATSFDRDLAEIQIAHKVAGDTEEAYWRSLMLEKRRPLVVAWADYGDGKSNVIQLAKEVA